MLLKTQARGWGWHGSRGRRARAPAGTAGSSPAARGQVPILGTRVPPSLPWFAKVTVTHRPACSTPCCSQLGQLVSVVAAAPCADGKALGHLALISRPLVCRHWASPSIWGADALGTPVPVPFPVLVPQFAPRWSAEPRRAWAPTSPHSSHGSRAFAQIRESIFVPSHCRPHLCLYQTCHGDRNRQSSVPDRPLLVGNANKQREPGLTEPLGVPGGCAGRGAAGDTGGRVGCFGAQPRRRS